MITNIFKSKLENASAPQCAWLYQVKFENSYAPGEGAAVYINTISNQDKFNDALGNQISQITLPTYSTKYWTANFLGTKKSYPIGRDYSGEGTMTLQLRDTDAINAFRMNFGNTFNSKQNDGFVRGEFEYPPFDRIRAYTYTHKTMFKDVTKDDKTEVMEAKGINLIFTFENVILLDVSFSDLSYTSEDVITCTIKFHYDYWTINDWENLP